MARTQPGSASAWRLARRFLPYLAPIRRRVSLSLALFLAGPPLGGAVLWFVKSLIDDVVVAGRFDLLPVIGAGYLAAAAGRVIVGFASMRLEASIVETVVRDLRAELYRHVMSLSPGSLGARGIGDVLAHLSTDVERAENLLYTGPSRLVADAIAVLFFTCILFVISWRLTFLALLVVPLLGLAVRHYAPRIQRAARVARHRASGWLSLAEERLGAGAVVHAYGTGEREAARFADGCSATRTAELRTIALEAWLNLAIECAVFGGGLLVLGAGAYEIVRGGLTLGSLVAFLGSIGALYEPIRGLAKSTGRFQRGAAGARRVGELFDTRSLVAERAGAKHLSAVRGAIEFRNVTFGYGRGDDAVHDLSLRIEPGEMVALVGPSGSGKSTLVRLLLRLHDPSSGAVLIDGTDLREVTLASLREAVAPVFQDPYIFRGSIADNVRYTRPDADDAATIAAARMARVGAFADRLPRGLATAVGPHGNWLSGGQRQRIALARALMRGAPILVLDEATASVDSEAEELIHRAVEEFAGERTILVVGHRLSSFRRADRVVVIDHGRVVESGSPSALLRAGTRYQELFAAQLEPGRPAA